MDVIEAADFDKLVSVSSPRISPDGEHVAFVRRVPEDDEAYEATIYLVSTSGGQPRRLTLADGVDSELRFSPSGDRLAFVSTRGGGDDRPQLWVLPTAGGEARQVTDVAGGVGGIRWRPDGNAIAFVQESSRADREKQRDIEVPDDYEPEPDDPRVIDRTVYRSQQRYFDGKRPHIYTVSLGDDHPGASDEIERVTDGEWDFGGPTWGDSETLYYTKRVGDPDPDDSLEYEIIAYDRPSGERETLHTTTGWGQGLAATADGRIAFPYTDPERISLAQTELHVFDSESGEVTVPTDGLDRTVGLEVEPMWGPDEESLYFTTPDEGADALWAAQWDETTPERVLRQDGSTVDSAHVVGDQVAFVRSEWDHPGDLFVATRDGEETRRLTRANEEYLENVTVAEPEPITFESDGLERQGWVLTPPEFDPEATYPLAVEVHGGPHVMWTTSGTMWHEFQTLAARGYVVFWSNPRGSAGYGEETMTAIERDWGAVTMRDVLAGVDAVTDREYVDGEQVFLTGGSFGGYMTAWLVGHSDRFEAAVSQRGVYNLLSFYGTTDAAYKLIEGDYGTTPWDEPELLWDHSPAAHVPDVETPTLVVHSDDDYRTPACGAELFYRGLRTHDVDTRFVRYPEEGHELSRSGQPGHRVDRLERIVRWFDGYSAYHDVPRALDRDPDAGLSASDDEENQSEG